MAAADQVVEAIAPLAGSPGNATFDLAELTFIDSSGVHALLRASERIDGKLVLRRPTPAVRKVLDLVRLTDASSRIVLET
jgi:anti-anti-sigma factor